MGRSSSGRWRTSEAAAIAMRCMPGVGRLGRGARGAGTHDQLSELASVNEFLLRITRGMLTLRCGVRRPLPRKPDYSGEFSVSEPCRAGGKPRTFGRETARG